MAMSLIRTGFGSAHELRRKNYFRSRAVMLISGHKSRSVLDRYTIVSERDIRNEGRKVTEYIRSKEAHPEAAKGSDRHTRRPAERFANFKKGTVSC